MNYRPTGSLKAFIDAGKNKTRILGSVERHVLTKPMGDGRRTNVLHPSDMVSNEWCYRASYYHLLGETPVGRDHSFKLINIFEEGHIIHGKWQMWLEEMGVLYGLWECQICGSKKWATSDDLDAEAEHTDDHCGPWDYREVPLNYEPLRIAGHSDGWIKGMGDDLMLEIKSIGVGTLRYEAAELLKENNNDFDKAWKALKAPFAKHVSQVQIYMKLAELIGMENYPQEAVLIYEAKPNQDVKEFVVKKSDFGIAHLFEAAEMIVKAVETKQIPECNVGGDWGCDRCREFGK